MKAYLNTCSSSLPCLLPVLLLLLCSLPGVLVSAAWLTVSSTRTTSARRPRKHLLWQRQSQPAGSFISHNTIPTQQQQRQEQKSHEQRHVPFFGNVYRLGGGNNNDKDKDRSFVDCMGVPTFAMNEKDNDSNNHDSENYHDDFTATHARHLAAIVPGPATVIDNVLTPAQCQAIVAACQDAMGFGEFCAGKNHHGALQIIVTQALTDTLTQRLAPHLDLTAVQALCQAMGETCHTAASLTLMGLNRRWRVYRYAPGGIQSFQPHIDAAFGPSGLTDDGQDLVWNTCPQGTVVSRLTLLLYLNDDFDGGETIFYEPQFLSSGNTTTTTTTPSMMITAVCPVTGSALVFPQAVGDDAVEYARRYWPLHEGSPVQTGSPKYVIRSDVLFEATTA